MSEHTSSKSEKYFEDKKKSSSSKNNGKKPMSNKDKRTLTILISVILVLTIGVGFLVAKLVNGSIFKDELGGNSMSDNGEWTDIDIQTPDDLDDGRTQKDNVYTFVCCGVDIDEYRADTIMLVTLDMNQKRADVMHILRDTYVSSSGKNYKINSFYARKKSDGIRQIIYNKMGIYPNYYVTLNFEAFRNIVDIIGGVEVDVPFDMKYTDKTQGLFIDLKAGKQLLDGDKAEQFVRYRKGSGGDGSDDSRQKRQEQFLTAFMQKCIDTCLNSPSKAVDIISRIIEHMNTNLSIAELTTFSHYGMEIGTENLHFHTLPGDYKYIEKTCFFEAYNYETLKLLNEYFNPYEEELTFSYVRFDEIPDEGSSSSDEESESSSKSSSKSSSDEEDSSSENEENDSSFSGNKSSGSSEE